MSIAHCVILDTDIGSDVDDALALAQILGTSEIDLLGVTTVYGDTMLRARLARKLASQAGHDVKVYAGMEKPLSGKDVWWAGHEGSLHYNLEVEPVEQQTAVDFLVEAVLANPGEIELICIAPLTNIASAISSNANFAKAVKHLWIMGGSFANSEPEHNFRSDTKAANIVFSSGIPATVTGLEVTRQIEMLEDQVERIAQTGEIGRSLKADIQQWWEYWDTRWNVPHDPVTVLTMVEPQLFEFGPVGQVKVTAEGDQEGQSLFIPDVNGWIRVATSVDASIASEAIVRGVTRADRSRFHLGS